MISNILGFKVNYYMFEKWPILSGLRISTNIIFYPDHFCQSLVCYLWGTIQFQKRQLSVFTLSMENVLTFEHINCGNTPDILYLQMVQSSIATTKRDIIWILLGSDHIWLPWHEQSFTIKVFKIYLVFSYISNLICGPELCYCF